MTDAGFIEIVRSIIISAVPILVAITFHEVSHGFVANRLGDPTAKAMGRLTLNPIPHIDPVGTIILPFVLLALSGGKFAFGWAKPVPINPFNFKHPRRGMAISALAGPVTNIGLAIASILIARVLIFAANTFLPVGAATSIIEPVFLMLKASIVINVVLAAFNLIPVPPLDGGRVLAGILPREYANTLDRIEPYGMIIILILYITGLYRIIMAPLMAFFNVLLRIFM